MELLVSGFGGCRPYGTRTLSTRLPGTTVPGFLSPPLRGSPAHRLQPALHAVGCAISLHGWDFARSRGVAL